MTRTVRQTGTGSAPAIPDVVLAQVRVEFRGDDVASAFSGAGHAAHSVVAAVRGAGVSDGDVATTGVGLQAVETGPWEDRRLEGYSATESLAVTIRDITSASAVLQAAAMAGGDAARIDSVSFAVSDGASPASAARDAAFADARARAEQYARLGGDTLGAVLSISDDPSTAPRPQMLFAAKLDGAGSGPAMEVGDRVVTAQVTVEWELV